VGVRSNSCPRRCERGLDRLNQSTDWRDRPVVHAYRLGHPTWPAAATTAVDQVKKKSAAPAVGIRSAARAARSRAPANRAGWLYSKFQSVLRNLAIDCRPPRTSLRPLAADRSIVRAAPDFVKKESATSASSRSAAQADRAGRSPAPLVRAWMQALELIRQQIGAIGLLSMPTAWLIRRGHRHRRSSKKEIGGARGRDSERGSGGPASRARESRKMGKFQPEHGLARSACCPCLRPG
jgi:hypothetical protein